MCQGFWEWLKQQSSSINDDIMICAAELRVALIEKNKSTVTFDELLKQSEIIQDMF